MANSAFFFSSSPTPSLRRPTAAILAIVVGLCLAAGAQATVPMEVVGGWGGSYRAVSVSGNTAYLGLSTGLVVVDVTDPAKPREVTSLALPEAVWDVHVIGSLAYVANGATGLKIVDVSDPAHPHVIGVCDTPYSARKVEIIGSLAYVADSQSLVIIDVSNPASPVQLSSLPIPNGVDDVDVSGSYAYVANEWLTVVNISDPAHPTLVTDTPPPPQGYLAVEARGGLVYAVKSNALHVYSLADPVNPVKVGETSVGFATDVEVVGTLAYLSDGSKGLSVVDVSVASAPALVGTLSGHLSADRVAISGNRAYLAGGMDGVLRIADVAVPSAPNLLTTYATGGAAFYIAVDGDYAYVSSPSSGLSILSIQDREHPIRVGSVSAIAGWGLAVAGNHVYIADSPWAGVKRLAVIDVSDKSNPVVVGSCPVTGNPMDVALSGNYALVADNAVQVVSISDPAHPVIVGTCATNGHAWDIVARGSLAYAATTAGTLDIVDFSSPSAPHLLGSAPVPDYAYGVALMGDVACIAAFKSGFRLVDVSNPAAPRYVSGIDTGGMPYTLQAAGWYAFVPNQQNTFYAIDVSNPAAPVVAGAMPLQAIDAAPSGNYAYVVGGSQNGVVRVVKVGAHNPARVDAIAPQCAPSIGSAHASITGADFADGASAKLTRPGCLDITATNVVVSASTEVACDLDLTGAQPGLYNVVVTNPDSLSGFLIKGFAVTLPSTAQAYGTSLRGLNDPIAKTACTKHRFTVWGRVETIDADSFRLNDGSGVTCKVIAPGYTDVTAGDLARVTGTLDLASGSPILISSEIRKLQ